MKQEEMMLRNIRAKQKEIGQSMVELAFSITVLMVLLAGTIDLGHAFFVWLALRDAAQEGAAYGSIKPDDSSGIIARVQDNYKEVIKDPAAIVGLTIGYNGPHCLGSSQSTIEIDIKYNNFPITMPFIGMFIGNSIPIYAKITDTIIAPKCP
jgi:TadE-like protein